MKVQQSKKNYKKRILWVLGLILVILVLGIGGSYLAHIGPFAKPADNTSTEKKSTSDKKSSTSSSDATSESDEPNQTDSTETNSDSNSTFVNPPITHQPTDTTPYPIENEHYRIAQKSSTSYDITLYPIVNNPSYSDYNSQLKAYKQEVLTYLKQRYGDISKFTFTWDPADAKNL